MNARINSNEPTFESVQSDLAQLQARQPSMEVFKAALNLSRQLVDVYMGANPEAQEAILSLDQAVAAFHSQVVLALQAAEQKNAEATVALNTRASNRPHHGRTFSLRQRRDARSSDLMAA